MKADAGMPRQCGRYGVEIQEVGGNDGIEELIKGKETVGV